MSNKTNTTAAVNGDKRALAPNLRFPEFRDAGEWTTETLGSLAIVSREKVGDNTCIPMSITSGVGLVSQLEKFGRIIAGNSYANYLLLKKNDFAYNKSATKEYPEGFIALYSGDELAAVPNSIFTCFRIKGDSPAPQYLNYLLLGNLHGKWLRKFIEVGARAHGSLSIDEDDLLALPVPLPGGKTSFREQQKIADCLSSADELIAAQVRKVDALKTHKKGLMQQLFPRKGETQPRLRFPEFRDAGEWEEKPLGEVATYENGKAYEQDITDDGRYVVVNSRFISTDGAARKYTNADYLTADADDVLMVLSDLPKGRALAKCYFVEEDDRYAVNQRVCRLKAKQLNPKFLFFILDRNPSLLAYDDGQNQTHLSKGSVLECPLLVSPSNEEQQRIADCLTALDDLITAHTQELAAFKTHKKGLMQQLFPSIEEA
ncbi:MAG: restriction endonuclease subunit S [Terricaulis sp.]